MLACLLLAECDIYGESSVAAYVAIQLTQLLLSVRSCGSTQDLAPILLCQCKFPFRTCIPQAWDASTDLCCYCSHMPGEGLRLLKCTSNHTPKNHCIADAEPFTFPPFATAPFVSAGTDWHAIDAAIGAVPWICGTGSPLLVSQSKQHT